MFAKTKDKADRFFFLIKLFVQNDIANKYVAIDDPTVNKFFSAFDIPTRSWSSKRSDEYRSFVKCILQS